MKPNKENIVNEMLIELEKGTSYAQCMKVNESKWKLSESLISAVFLFGVPFCRPPVFLPFDIQLL